MTNATNGLNMPGGCPQMEGNRTEPREARLFRAPRCQARTKAGPPCRSPAVGGKRVCRYHGGARGSGGPSGDRNGAFNKREIVMPLARPIHRAATYTATVSVLHFGRCPPTVAGRIAPVVVNPV